MKEKKNIDRIFQERFKDFEAQPDPKVWEGIEARLDGKKKKRRIVIPLWIKVGGVAALLALLTVIADFYYTPTNPNNQVVDGYKTDKDPNKKEQPAFTENSTVDSVQNDAKGSLANQDGQSVKASDASKTSKIVGKTHIKNAVATTQKQPETDQPNFRGSEKNKSTRDKTVATTINNDSVVRHKTDKAFAESTAENQQKEGSDENALAGNHNENGVNTQKEVKNDPLSTGAKNKNAVADQDNPSKKDSIAAQKSLLEIISEQKEKNALAENKAGNEKDALPSKRWGLTPMVAPVYYNSFAGSGIDPQFNGSSKNGDVNFSYGLQVSYAVSDNIKIRSGVNRVQLGYSTHDVRYSPGGAPQAAIQSINYKENAEVLNVSKNQASAGVSDAPNNFANLEVAPAAVQNGTLEQRLAYYEVPLEMAYDLVDKKIGVQLIGGLSTLFLNQDEILLQDSGFTTLLGTSNSLNNVSFSTNVGLGLDYKFSESIQFNLEPMFKYQLNAYKNSVQDFRPYYLGLYTGVSIKF